MRFLILVVMVVYFLFSWYAGLRNGRKRARDEEKQRAARRMDRSAHAQDGSAPSPPLEEPASEFAESEVQRQLRQFRQQATDRMDRGNSKRSRSDWASSGRNSARAKSMKTAFPVAEESERTERRQRQRETAQSAQPVSQLEIPVIPSFSEMAFSTPAAPPALPYATQMEPYQSTSPTGRTTGGTAEEATGKNTMARDTATATVVPPPIAGGAVPTGAVGTARGAPFVSTEELAAIFSDRRNVARVFVMNEIFQSPLQRWER